MAETRLTMEEELELRNFSGLQSIYNNGCPANVIQPIMDQLTKLCKEYPEVGDKMRNLAIADTGVILFRLVADTQTGQTTIRKFITNDFSYALQQWIVRQTAYVEFQGYSGEACEVYKQWLETKELRGEISSLAGHNPYEDFARAFIAYYCMEPTEFDTGMVGSVNNIIGQIRASKLVGDEIEDE